LQETRHVDHFTPIFFLRLSAVILCQLPDYENCDREAAENRRASAFGAVHGLCCIATGVFFANDADGGAFDLLGWFVCPRPNGPFHPTIARPASAYVSPAGGSDAVSD
jgi:hypothetical protein